MTNHVHLCHSSLLIVKSQHFRTTHRTRGPDRSKVERCGLPIKLYFPSIAETQDEKMYRVVMDRERWLNVVMGEKYTVDLKSTEKLAQRIPFPESAADELRFKLDVS